MKIFSITTSSNNCSVAIFENATCLQSLNLSNAKTHSENLMPLVSQLLQETNLSLSDINYLACDIGPGSFTGIRIGIATIKAISQISNIPIIPISSLEGLACISENSNGLIVSLIDARNNQAYCGIFNADYTQESNYMADSIETIVEVLKSKKQPLTFVGDASIIHKQLLEQNFPNATFENNSTLSADYIAKSALNKINSACSPDELLPLYLRKSQAERMADLKNG